MSGDPGGVRRLLPQSSQMQNFSFAPNNLGARENQKNYVFVDEHNRHKRLKVMRACEGCRRRKIKCDAATTNTWPCPACVRLKLHCVPPTVNYDAGGSQGFENERVEYESGSGDEEYHNQVNMHAHLGGVQRDAPQGYGQQNQYPEHVNAYTSVPYGQNPAGQPLQFDNMQPQAGVMSSYPPQAVFPVTPLQQQQQQQQQPISHQQHPSSQSPDSYQHDQYGPQDLADYLGVLKMDESGTAPYLSHKKKNTLVEEPAFEEVDEYKQSLPSVTSGPDMKIRIPPELMPDEETSLRYFDIYFTNVHPYVPVLNKTLFYQQWHSNRDSISPLLLEAIFAIAGRLSDEPSQGQQWLALVSKHADSFMDVARLSTLQAMLIVLKARESAPKRGYYYRAWMTVVQCVAMARDLGLDEHYEDHRLGRSCGSSPTDCITKTRIWQTIFVVELMIGSPQGRTDLSVDIDSVDFTVPRPVPGEDSEYHVTRQFTYFTRVVANVRRMNMAYSKIKKKKDWGLDPALVSLNTPFESWITELPADLHISFPSDASPPWLPSHFIGNLHSYYYLSIIMLHRPQLQFMDPSNMDGRWKHHMMLCYSSAKYLCRIQEAILQSFGLPGLLCMQRGINYTIYCVLTCTVLHLVALTSPDPDLNVDARDYFTRHMRILERCSSSWPMADMQQQIDALREAFSADMRKPFELKPTFPYGSPGAPVNASPPQVVHYHQPQLTRGHSALEQQQGLEQHQVRPQSQVSYTNHPITPPISAGGVDNKSDSPAVQSLVMMATGQRMPQQAMSNSVPIIDPSTWNPSRIFDQWNTTFGGSTTQTTSAPNTTLSNPTAGVSHSSTLPELPEANSTGLGLPAPSGSQPLMNPPQQYSAAPAPIPSFVSPSMWQESVASVYEGGLKRQWDNDGFNNSMMKRAR